MTKDEERIQAFLIEAENWFSQRADETDPGAARLLARCRAALSVVPDGPGVRLIAIERARQIAAEGWSAGHDDSHDKGEMVLAAVRYALHDLPGGRQPQLRTAAARAWRWASCWWKPKDPLRNLVRAGALIAAEIDRRQRTEAREQGGRR